MRRTPPDHHGHEESQNAESVLPRESSPVEEKFDWTPYFVPYWDDSAGMVFEMPGNSCQRRFSSDDDSAWDGKSDLLASSTFGSPNSAHTRVTNMRKLDLTPVPAPSSIEEPYWLFDPNDDSQANENWWALQKSLLDAESERSKGVAHTNEAAKRSRSSDDDDFSKLLAVVGQKRPERTRDSIASTVRPAQLSDINSTHFRQPRADSNVSTPTLEHIRKRRRQEEYEKDASEPEESEREEPEPEKSESDEPEETIPKSSPSTSQRTMSTISREYIDLGLDPTLMPTREFLETAYDSPPELDDDIDSPYGSEISLGSLSPGSLYDEVDLFDDDNFEEMSRGVVDLREVRLGRSAGNGAAEMGAEMEEELEMEIEARRRWYRAFGR
ncbi:hypothetical protein IQ07DRAFT_582816 [Pyrenochaeta sp. DS3sAY3a]|nr:hypothetical protein IQ07DRAFT_582816 [Pyrenochaeta sp. DS3sAY3a]